jgi:hypothetical protein
MSYYAEIIKFKGENIMFRIIINSVLCGAFCHVGSVIAQDAIQAAKEPHNKTAIKNKWKNFKSGIFRRK